MFIRPRGLFPLLILPALLVPGRAAAAETPEETPGVVFIVGGVGGIDVVGWSGKIALPLAGVHHEVRDFVWTTGPGRILRDLQDTDNLQARAGELAREVCAYRKQHPGRPIYLVGKSGGAGVVVMAAELLPPASVERIILLSPALSPGYDLSRTLLTARREVVCFHSSWERLILDWGTSQFGTMDRKYVPSAGLNGFVLPDDPDAMTKALYRRLVQVPWKPEDLLTGRGGLHSSTSMPIFLARHVAPWLK